MSGAHAPPFDSYSLLDEGSVRLDEPVARGLRR
jgi:hypothetical protein